MKIERVVAALGLLVVLGVGACTIKTTGEKKTGEVCDKGEDCAGNVCLTSVTCTGGKAVPNLCAGAECSGGKACASGEACITISGKEYCVPNTLCN